MLRISVFASGRGSNFRALAESLTLEPCDAEIVAVISNNSNAPVIDAAREYGIPSYHRSEKQFSAFDDFSASLLKLLEETETNFIVLAGYMKRIPPAVIHKFRNRIINIHPALLPEFGGKGMYGRYIHEAVLASHAEASGATIHFVDEEFDHGQIIAQEKVPVLQNDSPEKLAERILRAEHSLLPLIVRLFAEKKITIVDDSVCIDRMILPALDQDDSRWPVSFPICHERKYIGSDNPRIDQRFR